MSLIITGIIDGPLTGGLPKAVEIFVTADIADLSSYGIGSANNGGASSGADFTFPAVSATAGTYIYVSSEAPQFEAFMGFASDYVSSAAVNINGDDVIELFENGVAIDAYGVLGVDGTGTVWEHMDGWAARKPGTVASTTFNPDDWTFSGINALDFETSNATAATPFPTAGYSGPVTPPPAPVIVINEIDSDQTSIDSQEFIELFDGGVGNTSLTGLTLVQFNGNGESVTRSISLDGYTTDENGYFVIGSATVPNVDLVAFTTNGLENGADAVALYSGAAPSAPTTENLVDVIVYGTADADDIELLTLLGQTTQFDESANGTPTTDALARIDNGTGPFVAQAPTPGVDNVIPPPAVITLISTIQGTNGTQSGAVTEIDDRSDLTGQIVTIRAIVTADFQDGAAGVLGDLNGFYVQEEEVDYDFNDLTSEGIFIFDGSAPLVDVAYGDLVEITGTVTEFFGETQITATSVQVLDTAQTVPSAVEVVFPTAGVTVTNDGNYVANLEAYEGMLVTIAQDMTVSEMFNLDRFGTYNVTADGRVAQFTQDNAPSVEGYAQHLQDVAKRTLQLDDGLSTQNPSQLKIIDGNDGFLTAADSFRMGDTISALTGVVTYSFDAFKLNSATGTYSQQNPRPAAPDVAEGNFKVASMNVLNYFTTIDLSGVSTDIGQDPRGADTQEEFDRQAIKLVNAILAIDADVLGLLEIENDFAGDVFAVKDIVDRLNAALGDTVYAFVDPGQEFVGGDAIANALIYKVDSVALKGEMSILETFEGRNFLDPLNSGSPLNRAAIAQTFEDLNTGQTLTVSVNHLKSKGSLSGLEVDNDQGDGQGNNNATRTEAAAILADWLASDPTGQGSDNVLILGDLNSYAMEDPITQLAEDGYTDIARAVLGEAAYSYVFDGQIGTLDYVLANAALMESVVGVSEWHVNADEADAIDYNLDFGRDPTLFDGATPARNSDHDPVVVSFQFEPVYNLIIGTNGGNFLVGTSGRDRIEGLNGNDWIFAGEGDDYVLGGGKKDYIIGWDGNDILDGGDGNDLIYAGKGDDRIISGTGRDNVHGDVGADVFVFSAEIANNGKMDRTSILDYTAGDDLIELGGATVRQFIEKDNLVELRLNGDNDKIFVYGVSLFDDIQFADEILSA